MAATDTSVSTANLVESSWSPCWGRGCSMSPCGIGNAVSGEVRPAGFAHPDSPPPTPSWGQGYLKSFQKVPGGS